jgi:hypothetical protein
MIGSMAGPRDVQVVVDINAPPDRVFAVWRDVERWPVWNATVTSIRLLGGGPLAMGSRVKIRQPGLLPAVWGVTRFDEPGGFAWVTGGLGVRVEADHSAVAAGGGCTVTLTLRFSGPLGGLASRIYGGLSRRHLAMEAEGLRRAVEP